MSAAPEEVVLDAIRRGESSLPALKRETGLDYPILLRMLEGPLSFQVYREETATGALRFHPSGYQNHATVVNLPVGPFCVKCQVECKKTHKDGNTATSGGEARWMCPKCKVRFPGTHHKGSFMAKLSDYASADHRLNEIIAAGSPKERTEEEILKSPRTEAEDLCGCGRSRNHKGRCSARRGESEGPIEITGPLSDAEEDEGEDLCGCGKARGHRGFCGKRDIKPKTVCAGCKESAEVTTDSLCWDCYKKKMKAKVDEEVSDAALDLVEPVIPEQEEASPVGEIAPAPTGLVLYDSVQDCVNEVVNWPKERIAEFFATMAEAMGLAQTSPPREIKLAWSRDFEEHDPEGTTGLTYLYLISMLHHRMEEHEKQAVWVLVQYLKRIECAKEERAVNEK